MKDSACQALINPDWDFKKMGIGGLDKEFSDIFRRAFASRVFPPDVVERLGMKHVRRILLFGPPGMTHEYLCEGHHSTRSIKDVLYVGTGKTLMARKIGEMLQARQPKIVNGPSKCGVVDVTRSRRGICLGGRYGMKYAW